jgi:hypothetical protein
MIITVSGWERALEKEILYPLCDSIYRGWRTLFTLSFGYPSSQRSFRKSIIHNKKQTTESRKEVSNNRV